MFMFRSAQRGNNKAFDFGKSREVIKTRRISFDDVAGNDEEKEELVEVVDFKSPAKYNEMGAHYKRYFISRASRYR